MERLRIVEHGETIDAVHDQRVGTLTKAVADQFGQGSGAGGLQRNHRYYYAVSCRWIILAIVTDARAQANRSGFGAGTHMASECQRCSGWREYWRLQSRPGWRLPGAYPSR